MRVQEFLKPHIASGLVSKVMLDTYERELERYGGDDGMPLCEAIFHADSNFALSVMDRFHGETFSDQRWCLTLASSDRLLQDFGYNLSDRLRLVSAIRNGFRREFGIVGRAEHAFGKRFRQERMKIEPLLWDPQCSNLKDSIQLLDVRSQAIAGPVSDLRRLCMEAGDFNLDSILQSLIHMTSNRLLRSAQRPQELAISDFLVRAYESKIARTLE
jgi:thiopeptide-type bacteriocin biosynthesis protein